MIRCCGATWLYVCHTDGFPYDLVQVCVCVIVCLCVYSVCLCGVFVLHARMCHYMCLCIGRGTMGAMRAFTLGHNIPFPHILEGS